ncbi:MAG TPA: hypothetical protein VKE98_08695, partial [Gemmataceae bacterium]|nr:hypothetical protein [Gemmataceae bacterium]
TFAGHPGDRKEAIRPGRLNPWAKPPFFEKVVKRNIDAELKGKRSIMVHDIEFEFEEDLDKAWADGATRKASGVGSKEKFRAAYYKEWASWYTLPCKWAKEKNPKVPMGIYGPQPFRRDFRGRSGKDADQIDGTHRTDEELWEHIDPAVDFYITSVYYTLTDGEPACTISHIGHMGTYSIRKDSDARTHDVDCPNCRATQTNRATPQENA